MLFALFTPQTWPNGPESTCFNAPDIRLFELPILLRLLIPRRNMILLPQMNQTPDPPEDTWLQLLATLVRLPFFRA